MLSSTRLRGVLGPPVQMAIGLGLFGLAGYVFVAATGNTLGKSEANLAIAFYFLANVVGPGIFYALEQVTSRSLSKALAEGSPVRPAMAKARRAGACLVAVVVLALGALSPILVGSTLHDDWVLFAEVVAAAVIGCGLHHVRGLLGGHQRFSAYAGTLAIEGIARLGLCLLLMVLGADGAWLFGIAYLASSMIAALIGLVWVRHAEDVLVDAPSSPPIGKGLAALAVATLLAQLLPNLAPLAVTSRLAEDSAIALAFGQAAVIARIPLLLFFPVQTMLLPNLSASVAKGEFAAVGRRVKLVLAGVAAAGVVCSALFLVVGPWVLRTFLNTTADLDSSVMLMLAVSTIVLIGAYAVQPALVALHNDHVVTLGWAIGSVVTLGMVLLPFSPVPLGALAQVVGPVLTLGVVLWGLRSALRAR